MYTHYTMTTNALLMFHQGWTDIVNCLPLVNWYARKYTKLFVVFRDDAKPLTQFYLRGLQNVFPIYIPKIVIEVNWLEPVDIIHHKITHFEFIGHYDVQRQIEDPHRNAYNNLNAITDYPFERLFYESYDIPYSERVTSFTLYRNVEAEESYYSKHVTTEPYICVHAIENLHVQPEEGTSIINLGETTGIFFDAIRVLQHAKAIHVLDSVWAAVCYMIDAKYGILETVPVYVYCQRDFYRMFTQPVHRPNWTIVHS